MKIKRKQNRYNSEKLSPISESVFIELIEIFKEFEEGENHGTSNRKNSNPKITRKRHKQKVRANSDGFIGNCK